MYCAEDNVRTAALFPMDATRESVKFAQQGNGNEFHLKLISLIWNFYAPTDN